MQSYVIEFNYKVLKENLIPIYFTKRVLELNVEDPVEDALDINWEEIIHRIYPKYISVEVTNVTFYSARIQDFD